MIHTKKSQTLWLTITTILILAHICAILALIGLTILSPITQEMGPGAIGVIITSLTFVTLLINTALLLKARQKIKTDSPAQVRSLLFTAGGIFLAYNLIATLLNPIFLQNLIISSIVLTIACILITRTDKQK